MPHPAPEGSAGEPVREKIVWVRMEELAVGMFVHPLSSASFLIARKEQMQTLAESGAKGVFVDLV